MDKIKLPEILRAKMQEKHLTQAELAKEFGVVQQTISQYCTGINEPDFKTTQKLAEYFNISLDEMITGAKYENKTTREVLRVDEDTINGLKNLCAMPLAPELLADKQFADIFEGVVASLSLNLNAVKGVVNAHGNSLTAETFNELILTQAVTTLDNYFREFLRRNIPVLQERAKERATAIISAMPKK